MNIPAPSAGPKSIEEILKLEDAAFVFGAYSAILDRDPDPDGLANYLGQVRAGVDKMQILAELAFSTEGKSITSAGLRGRHLIYEYLHRTTSLRHKLLQRLGGNRMEAALQQVRILRNRLYLLEQRVAQQSSLLGELLHSDSNSMRLGSQGHPTDTSTFAEIKRAIAERHRE